MTPFINNYPLIYQTLEKQRIQTTDLNYKKSLIEKLVRV